MKQPSRKTLIVNIFGALGYLSVTLQWLWVTALLLPTLLDNKTVQYFLLPHPNTEPQSSLVGPITSSSLITTVIAVGVTVLMIIITIILLVRLPAAIAKTSKTATTKTAEAALPVFTHHKQLSPVAKRKLTIRLIKVIKFIVILAPLCALIACFFAPIQLSIEIAILVECCLAISSLIWFSLEYLVAYRLRVKPIEIS